MYNSTDRTPDNICVMREDNSGASEADRITDIHCNSIEQFVTSVSATQADEKQGIEQPIGASFSVGDMVWAKVRSHPWWPGQIFEEADASKIARAKQKSDRLLIAFFGDGTFAWLQPNQLVDFKLHFEQYVEQTAMKSFRNAVAQALEEVCRRSELGLSCSCHGKFVHSTSMFPKGNTGIQQIGLSVDYHRDIAVSKQMLDMKKLLQFVKAAASSPFGPHCLSIESSILRGHGFGVRTGIAAIGKDFHFGKQATYSRRKFDRDGTFNSLKGNMVPKVEMPSYTHQCLTQSSVSRHFGSKRKPIEVIKRVTNAGECVATLGLADKETKKLKAVHPTESTEADDSETLLSIGGFNSKLLRKTTKRSTFVVKTNTLAEQNKEDVQGTVCVQSYLAQSCSSSNSFSANMCSHNMSTTSCEQGSNQLPSLIPAGMKETSDSFCDNLKPDESVLKVYSCGNLTVDNVECKGISEEKSNNEFVVTPLPKSLQKSAVMHVEKDLMQACMPLSENHSTPKSPFILSGSEHGNGLHTLQAHCDTLGISAKDMTFGEVSTGVLDCICASVNDGDIRQVKDSKKFVEEQLSAVKIPAKDAIIVDADDILQADKDGDMLNAVDDVEKHAEAEDDTPGISINEIMIVEIADVVDDTYTSVSDGGITQCSDGQQLVEAQGDSIEVYVKDAIVVDTEDIPSFSRVANMLSMSDGAGELMKADFETMEIVIKNINNGEVATDVVATSPSANDGVIVRSSDSKRLVEAQIDPIEILPFRDENLLNASDGSETLAKLEYGIIGTAVNGVNMVGVSGTLPLVKDEGDIGLPDAEENIQIGNIGENTQMEDARDLLAQVGHSQQLKIFAIMSDEMKCNGNDLVRGSPSRSCMASEDMYHVACELQNSPKILSTVSHDEYVTNNPQRVLWHYVQCLKLFARDALSRRSIGSKADGPILALMKFRNFVYQKSFGYGGVLPRLAERKQYKNSNTCLEVESGSMDSQSHSEVTLLNAQSYEIPLNPKNEMPELLLAAQKKKPKICLADRTSQEGTALKQHSLKLREKSAQVYNVGKLVQSNSGSEGFGLFMKFPKSSRMPSESQIKATFTRFGVLQTGGTKVYKDAAAARVVFKHKWDAEVAYNYVKRKPLFGQASVSCRLKQMSGPLRPQEEMAGEEETVLRAEGNLSVQPVQQDQDRQHTIPCTIFDQRSAIELVRVTLPATIDLGHVDEHVSYDTCNYVNCNNVDQARAKMDADTRMFPTSVDGPKELSLAGSMSDIDDDGKAQGKMDVISKIPSQNDTSCKSTSTFTLSPVPVVNVESRDIKDQLLKLLEQLRLLVCSPTS